MKQPKNIENTPETDNAYEWLDDLGDEICNFIQNTTYDICDFVNDLALKISGS